MTRFLTRFQVARPMPTRCGHRFRTDDGGATLVEFAILVTLLLTLVFGAIDFGRALYTSNNLTAAAREAARYAARLPNPGAELAAIRDTAAAVMSPFGNAPVNAASQVVVTCKPGCGTSTLQSIQVQINYPFTWLTPLPALLGKSLTPTLRARATFRWEGA